MDVETVDFVEYTVSDLGTALPFYRDTLGLDLEKHIEEYGWAEFALAPTTLALSESSEGEQVDPNGGDVAVALAVEDVEAAVEELRDAGASVLHDPIDTGVCDKATIADPDGNPIVLHRRHDGTHGRKNPLP